MAVSAFLRVCLAMFMWHSMSSRCAGWLHVSWMKHLPKIGENGGLKKFQFNKITFNITHQIYQKNFSTAKYNFTLLFFIWTPPPHTHTHQIVWGRKKDLKYTLLYCLPLKPSYLSPHHIVSCNGITTITQQVHKAVVDQPRPFKQDVEQPFFFKSVGCVLLIIFSWTEWYDLPYFPVVLKTGLN